MPHQTHPTKRMLITAGPTHEPIDEVRFLANRSSGAMGAAIAAAAAGAGWDATLLLGPSPQRPDYPNLRVQRFRSSKDLQRLLRPAFANCDVLVMAAAVADYRPRNVVSGKLRRRDEPLTLELEPVPDLVAGCAAGKQPEQVVVAFALLPAETLLAEAGEKLQRKGVDLIVANPLETMEAPEVEAVVLGRGPAGGEPRQWRPEGGRLSKDEFARWLVGLIGRFRDGTA